MFHFNFMKINNSLKYERSKTTNIYKNFYDVFILFFDDETFEKLMQHINQYAILYFVFSIFNVRI